MYSQQPFYKVPTMPQSHPVPVNDYPGVGYHPNGQPIYNVQIPVLPNTELDNWHKTIPGPYDYPQSNHPFVMNSSQQSNFVPKIKSEDELPVIGFKCRILEVGTRHRVFISYVDDGPNKFSIQMKETKECLKELMSEIQSHDPLPLREPPLPGSVCLARLKSNKSLCRAVVMATTDTQIKIYYVDFGHTEVVAYTDIYQIPPKFIIPRAIAIRFCLTGLKEMNITDDVKKYFKNRMQGSEVDLVVCEPEGPFLIQYGDIFLDDGRNVKDLIKEEFPDIIAMQKGLVKWIDGMTELVRVSYIVSCSKFFVQLEKNLEDLDEMMASIEKYVTSDATPVNDLSIGSMYLALYHLDNQWYRVKILEIKGDSVNVLYVDYGNKETVLRNMIRSIRKDIAYKLAPQAICCALNGFSSENVNENLDAELENLVCDRTLCMKVVRTEPSCLMVELTDVTSPDPKSIQMKLYKLVAEKARNSSERVSVEPKRPNECFQQHDGVVVHHTNGTNVADSNPFQVKNTDDRFKPTSKSWKDTQSEQKNSNNNNSSSPSFNRDNRSDRRFNRNNQNERFIRDSGNDRFSRRCENPRTSLDGGNNRFQSNQDRFNKLSSNENDKTDRHGGGKFSSDWRDNSFMSSKFALSDNESTTSSTTRGNKRSDGWIKARDVGSSDFTTNRENGNIDYKPKQFDDNGRKKCVQATKDRNFDKSREMINFDICNFSTPKDLEISAPTVTIGSTSGCEVVYHTSPTNFFIQLFSQHSKLDELMREIAATYDFGGITLESSRVKLGVACVAQYSEDEKWYRAVIKSVKESTVTVCFVDYGNQEDVTFDKLKEIKEEFTRLPSQAIPCKMLGISRNDWSVEEIDSFGDAVIARSFQAEFVARDNDVFEVVLRYQKNEGGSQTEFLNEIFCPDFDLMQAKNSARIKGRALNRSSQIDQPDHASRDCKWIEGEILSEKESVIVTWFDDPSSFYCQSINKQAQFRSMMEEIQRVYARRQPISNPLLPGTPVIAVFPEDRALYRAKIVEGNSNRKYVVQYIDFGNKAILNQRDIYPIEKRFMNLPKQGIRCALKNIVPVNEGSWSKLNLHDIEKYFDADDYECVYHEKLDDRYLVSLSNNGIDVSETLIKNNLANSSVPPSTNQNFNVESPVSDETDQRFNINLLPGQQMHVKVSNVESVFKFYVQFPSAEKCDETISSYMGNENPVVMPRLSSHGVCLGAGCLILKDGLWRRAVVISFSETTSINVRLIDTGAYDMVQLNCVLALPGKLAWMQNQAIECGLDKVQPSASLDERFRNLVENKVVIMHVNEIENNRLIVHLYDLSGEEIKLTNVAELDKVSPICPMPILNPMHRVNVSCVNHSNSLWLQFSADAKKDEKLNSEMTKFYAVDRETVKVQPGILCVVKKDNKICYRAKVIRITDGGALVNLLDYGINDDVSLDKLKILDPKFYVPHQLAIHVSLCVTLKGTTEEQIQALKPHLKGKEFTAIFYNIKKKWVVELVDNGKKLSETLSNLNLVREDNFRKESEEAGGMTVGRTYKGAVTHVDSPTQFWFQKSDETPIIIDLQEKLQNAVADNPILNGVPEVGSLCAAVYSGDGAWYRAEVVDAIEELTTVRFIDFGNTDAITDMSKIKELPDSMKTRKAYGIKCRLDVIPKDCEDWSEETCQRLEDLVLSTECLEAVLLAESIPRRVDLIINGKSVSETLVKEGFVSKVQSEQQLIEEIVEIELDPRSAFISHIYTPNEFYVQQEKSVPDLETIQDRLMVADMFPEVSQITRDLLCVAKYSDNNWYRARVISVSESGTEVFFIDYGNFANVTEIRVIPEDVAATSPLSKKCSLQLPNYVSDWPKNATDVFFDLAADGATIFLMDIIEERETTIVKLTLEGADVAEKLAPRQFSFITHINSPTDFYLHEEMNILECDKIQTKLSDAENFPAVTTVEDGLICAAQFPNDDQWYRAKIISSSEKGEIIVSYIDYGNTSSCTKLRVLPDDLANKAPFAKRCTLKLPSNVQEWPEDAFDKFCRLAGEGSVPFLLDIVEENENKSVVNLTLGKRSVVEILVSGASAETNVEIPDDQEETVPEEDTIEIVPVNDNSDIILEVTIDIVPVENSAEIIPEENTTKIVPEEANAKIILGETIIESVPAKVITTFASEQETTLTCSLAGSSTHTLEQVDFGKHNTADLIPVNLTHLNTLAEFWIQKKSNTNEISHMKDVLSKANDFAPLVKSKEGVICAARSPNDSCWYRAKILSQNEKGTYVLFIDYGNSSIVSELRSLPSDLSNVPNLAKKCRIQLSEGVEDWPEGTFDKFFALADNGNTCFSMHIISDGETAVVELYLDGESVAKKISHLTIQDCSKPITVTETKKDHLVSVNRYVPEIEPVVTETENCFVPQGKSLVFETECVDSIEASINCPRLKIVESRAFAGKSTAEQRIIEVMSVMDQGNESDNIVVTENQCNEEVEKVYPSFIMISYVLSPNEFWGIMNENTDISKLLKYAEEWPLLEGIVEDKLCAAKVTGEWHRARILSINNESVRVLLIDCGEDPICNELRQLPSDLEAIPPLAKKFSLKLSESSTETWRNSQSIKDVFSKFRGITLDMELIADGEIPLVELYYQGEQLSKILLLRQEDDSSNTITGRLPPEGAENLNMGKIIHVSCSLKNNDKQELDTFGKGNMESPSNQESGRNSSSLVIPKSPTAKTPHSEKLVAAVVNPDIQDFCEQEEMMKKNEDKDESHLMNNYIK